ncbi:hypothetical protein Q8A73_017507 [Channa argus]|nr:hypothetical protein Q8A73_017507 [Channa argus]
MLLFPRLHVSELTNTIASSVFWWKSEITTLSPEPMQGSSQTVAFAYTGFKENLEHTARSQIKKLAAKTERATQQRQVSRNPVLYATGEGSVFNAQNKRSEMAGAAEVQEDSQLKVDLPIDQVEAKIVEEEYEDRLFSASPCKTSLHDSEGLCLQRSLSAGFRRDPGSSHCLKLMAGSTAKSSQCDKSGCLYEDGCVHSQGRWPRCYSV